MRYVPVLLLSLLAACASDPVESLPDASVTPDVGDDFPPRPLPYVPMKTVGSPVHIGDGPLWLTDVSEQVGLGGDRAGGLAFVDFDDDGWPDLIGSGPQGFAVYRNVGGRFEDATHDVLGPLGPDERDAGAATLADVDGDGDLDLLSVSRRGLDLLWLSDGYGHFAPAPNNGGIPALTSSELGSFSDVDRDGDLDLYLARGRRLDADAAGDTIEPGYGGNPNHLFLNDGTGQFTDVTATWGAAAGHTSETFQAVFADFDRDGDDDALVVRDFLSDHLLINQGGRFDDSSTGISPHRTTLMGASVGDLDGDGHLDLFCTNGPADFVYRGRGDGTFENVFESILDGPDPSAVTSGWGVAVVDLDNDGDQDVITVSADDVFGHVGGGGIAPGALVVFENDGGRLRDVTEEVGVDSRLSAYALAVADFDLDGDMDIAIGASAPATPGSAPVGIRLLRNDSARAAGGHFVEVSLRAPEGNRFAVGAIIDVETGDRRTSRVVTAGESHLAAHSLVQHFGLGARPAADRVTITWPGGPTQVVRGLPAGYHRLAPFDGECCGPGGTCEGNLPACPTWHPAWDPCQGASGCSLCALACGRLSECGNLGFDCAAECVEEELHPAEVRCVMAVGCEDVPACLGEDPGDP